MCATCGCVVGILGDRNATQRTECVGKVRAGLLHGMQKRVDQLQITVVLYTETQLQCNTGDMLSDVAEHRCTCAQEIVQYLFSHFREIVLVVLAVVQSFQFAQ
jgi:hypothetical protein